MPESGAENPWNVLWTVKHRIPFCHRPHERNKVQAFNDFLIFGSMALSSFSSGQLLARFGWATVNEVIFPAAFLAGGLLLWLSLRQRVRTADQPRI